MNVNKILKQLRKPDNFTDRTISEEYPADWDADNIFEKSFENFIAEKNRNENTGECEGIVYKENTVKSKISVVVKAIIPAAACFAVIFAIAKSSADHRPEKDNMTAVVTQTEMVNSGVTAGITEISENPPYLISESSVSVTDTKSSETHETVLVVFKDSSDTASVTSVRTAQDEEPHKSSETSSTKISDAAESEYVETEITSSVTSEITVSGTTVVTSASETIPAAKKMLTMSELVKLSEKGTDLDWSDFAGYISENIGSGMYVLKYEIEDSTFYVLEGGIPEQKPAYIRLYSDFDDEFCFDVANGELSGIEDILEFF